MSTRCWPNLNGLIWKLVHSVNGVTFLTFLFEIAVLAFLTARFEYFQVEFPAMCLPWTLIWSFGSLHYWHNSTTLLFISAFSFQSCSYCFGPFWFWKLTLPFLQACALNKISAKVRLQNERQFCNFAISVVFLVWPYGENRACLGLLNDVLSRILAPREKALINLHCLPKTS